jgi:Flp pilus assembly pilin Flp
LERTGDATIKEIFIVTGGGNMNVISELVHAATWLRTDRRAQDMIEYSLAAAFVAVAVSAFFPPAIAPALSNIFSLVVEVLPDVP